MAVPAGEVIGDDEGLATLPAPKDVAERRQLRGLGEELMRMDVECQQTSATDSGAVVHFRCSWLRGGCLRSFLQSVEPDLYGVLSPVSGFETANLGPYSEGMLLLKTHGEKFLELLINKAPDTEWMEWLFKSLLIAARADGTGVFHRLFALCKSDPGFWAVDSRVVRLLNHTAGEGSAEVLSDLLEVDFFLSSVKDVDQESHRSYLPSALFSAAKNGHRNCVALLIRAGSPLEFKWALGRTALTTAVENGHEGIVLELLAAGADVDTINGQDAMRMRAVNYPNYTPLGIAAAKDNVGMVDILLAAGADFGKNRSDSLPVIIAAQAGHCGPLERLLLRGADANVVNSKGQSALHLACFYSREGAVKILLRRDADFTSRCDGGLLPYDVVAMWALWQREHAFGGRYPCTLSATETAAADRIYGMLLEASEWGRRGWLVMMRARCLVEAEPPDECSSDKPSPAEQDPPGDARETTEPEDDGACTAVEGLSLAEDPSIDTSGGLDEHDSSIGVVCEKPVSPPFGGHSIGKDRHSQRRSGWEQAVEWLVRCPDERGIFRQILSYL